MKAGYFFTLGVSAAALLCSYVANIASAEELSVLSIRPGCGCTYTLPRKTWEIELNKLAQEACSEDCWIRFNDFEIDVGSYEGSHTVNVDLDHILLLAKAHLADPKCTQAYTEIVFYHIHPLNLEDGLELSPPSGADILLHAELKRIFRDKFKAGFKSRVFDGFGMWEYDVTSKLEKTLVSLSRTSSKSKRLIDSLDDKDDALRDRFLYNPQVPFGEGIAKYIKSRSAAGVLLKYTHLSD